MKVLDARWPFVPEVHLFHERGECLAFLSEQCGDFDFHSDSQARAWCDDDVAAVLLEYSGDRFEEYALLVHEAYHVVSMHFDYLGVEHADDEFVAYGTQLVSRELMRAHKRWREDGD